MPLIRGETDAIRANIFGEVTFHAAYEPMRCIRTERYKYIRYFDDYGKVVMPNIDDSRSKRFLMAHGLTDRNHQPKEMLFDLYFDPFERDNLADREDYARIKEGLANKLHNWMVETDDPLLKGPVPLPVDGYANPQNDIHPS
jgi:arylsulfatase A-like enzyme